MNTEDLVIWGLRHGYRLPQTWLRAVARVAAEVVCIRGGQSVKQLRSNLATITSLPPGRDLDSLVNKAVVSYFRYYAELAHLPVLTPEQLRARCRWVNADSLQKDLQQGSACIALGHCGNWDLAGAWVSARYAPVLTVAEILESSTLFQEFTGLRQDVGMEILGAQPGTRVFDQLVAKVKTKNYLVALLADRDISGTGIEVTLGGQEALVAAGPAALALQENLPLYAAYISYERLRGARRQVAGTPWGICIHVAGPFTVASGLSGDDACLNLTRKWVAAFDEMLNEHPTDWHMMQPVFVKDLDPARLERAKQRVEQRKANSSNNADLADGGNGGRAESDGRVVAEGLGRSLEGNDLAARSGGSSISMSDTVIIPKSRPDSGDTCA